MLLTHGGISRGTYNRQIATWQALYTEGIKQITIDLAIKTLAILSMGV